MCAPTQGGMRAGARIGGARSGYAPVAGRLRLYARHTARYTGCTMVCDWYESREVRDVCMSCGAYHAASHPGGLVVGARGRSSQSAVAEAAVRCLCARCWPCARGPLLVVRSPLANYCLPEPSLAHIYRSGSGTHPRQRGALGVGGAQRGQPPTGVNRDAWSEISDVRRGTNRERRGAVSGVRNDRRE